MKTLQQNMVNLFGQVGQRWMDDLPLITKKCAEHWSLTDLQPVNNLSYNYVVKAIKGNQLSVVVKISCDKNLINDEVKALRYFKGHGCIALIDHAVEYDALLLQQAIPGVSLKSLCPQKISVVMDHYVAVMHRLISVQQPDRYQFKSMADWLQAIDQVNSALISKKLLQKAITLKNHLLKLASQSYLLHGDLHCDNILQHDDRWLAIDPKGIIGDIGFEAAAFDFIYPDELEKNKKIGGLFEQRVRLLAEKLNIDPQRLLAWVYVRLILSAAWFIEDNGDPTRALSMAEQVYGLLEN